MSAAMPAESSAWLRDYTMASEMMAVRDFLDWLYEHGPNPDSVTREALLAAYTVWKRGRS